MLCPAQRNRLVHEARAAAARAFLTSVGGTAYGAAVLTTSGRIYRAGQYSSFNHVTNIHAEHAALVQATMADDPDILALAVASTGAEPVTRPCGVCRQVLAEHARRVGRDFEVLMACRHDSRHEIARISELLPFGWSPGQNPAEEPRPDLRGRLPTTGVAFTGQALRSGDHVKLSNGCIAMVWDGEFEPGGSLVKVKYAPAEEKLRKVAHSFSEPLQYLKELHDLGWFRQAKCCIRGAIVQASDVTAVFPALPLGGEIGQPPGPLLDILATAGVDVSAIRVTGSRAIGLQQPSSDWDLLVPVERNRLPAIREQLAWAVEQGTFAIPSSSGTWKLLDRIFPGGREAVLRSRRFADTLQSGGVSVALIFVPPHPPGVCIDKDWIFAGRAALHGEVLRASGAAYKRAEYELADAKGTISVTCYHKAANLLRAGDVISLCGWLLRRENERRLIQILPEPDRITWWRTSTTSPAFEVSEP